MRCTKQSMEKSARSGDTKSSACLVPTGRAPTMFADQVGGALGAAASRRESVAIGHHGGTAAEPSAAPA